jgi:glucose-1-phosphate cytidylyltransferase
MKVVILAGGYGTRLAELTQEVPKPLIEIGGRPVIWHILHLYAAQGFKDFIIALGYKGHMIKDYFLHYHARNANLSITLVDGNVQYHKNESIDWQVTLIDTGNDTMTGGRIKRLKPYLGDEAFMLTYGDGVSNVDLRALRDFHNKHGGLATVTAVHPTSRYGKLELGTNGKVTRFVEKPEFGEDWINGGFFVLAPGFLDLIRGDDTVLEREPLESAARNGQLYAYRHTEFWHSMDTLRDRNHLNRLWNEGCAPWKIW